MRLFLPLFLLSLCSLAGCNANTSKDEDAPQPMSPAALRGEHVFNLQCAVCHNARSTEPLHGPGLKGLYKRQTLPSGIPLTDEHLRQNIERGRAMMPPFGNVLDQDQINDLVAYLKTL